MATLLPVSSTFAAVDVLVVSKIISDEFHVNWSYSPIEDGPGCRIAAAGTQSRTNVVVAPSSIGHTTVI